ncbi:hypothetical protein BHE74_00002330 [Ensete ventricosum]|nr:hypothetical protein BHE74_00002330 [Ensete ventricosum]
MVPQRWDFRVCALKLASDESFGHPHMGGLCMIGAARELDCFSAHIRLREPGKSEDEAESTDPEGRDEDARYWIIVLWAWQHHGIAEPSNLVFSTTKRMDEVKYLSSLTYQAEELCISSEMTASSSAALLLCLSLLFFTLVSSSYCPPPPMKKHKPPPRPKPTPKPPTPSCPVDTVKLGACANVLGGLINLQIGTPPKKPCCSLIEGLADLEAALCLCTAIKADVLGIILNVDVDLTLLLNYCGKKVPYGYLCA